MQEGWGCRPRAKKQLWESNRQSRRNRKGLGRKEEKPCMPGQQHERGGGLTEGQGGRDPEDLVRCGDLGRAH